MIVSKYMLGGLMYMKKVYIFFIVLLISSLAIGCSQTIETEEGSVSLKDNKVVIKDDESNESVTIDGDNMEVTDEDGNVTVKIDNDTVTVDDEGTSIEVSLGGGGVKLPDGFPKDVLPLYKGYSIIYAETDKNIDDGEVFRIQYVVSAPMKKIAQFYDDLLKDTEDYVKADLGDIIALEGRIDGYYINLSVTTSDAIKGAAHVAFVIEEE